MSTRRFFLSLLILVGLVFENVLLVSGQAANPVAVKPGENPSMAFIFNSAATNRRCGATVLTSSWVLTTFECCFFEGVPWAFNDLTLIAGSTQFTVALQTPIDPPAQTRTFKLPFTLNLDASDHPDRLFRNSFCLLEVNAPLTLSDKDVAPPAGIYSLTGRPPVGSKFVAYRWSSSTASRLPPFPMTLEKVPCTVIEWVDCLDNFPGANDQFTFCCTSPAEERGRTTLANQLMFPNEMGHLFLVAHQLAWGPTDRTIGLFQVVSRAFDWITERTGPIPLITGTTIDPATVKDTPKPAPTVVAVGPGEDPSMGLISSAKVPSWHCGGTIVRPNVVFTTADCCIPIAAGWKNGELPANDLSFTGGAVQLTPRQTSDNGPVQTRTSRWLVRPRRGKFSNNYCSLQLDTPLTSFGKDLAPADIYRLPTGETTVQTGTKLIVFRWTTASTSPPFRFTLEKVSCTVMNWLACLVIYRGADPTTTFCCDTKNPDALGKTEANQLMFQNATGHLLFVGHQLSYGTNTNVGLFTIASEIKSMGKPIL